MKKAVPSQIEVIEVPNEGAISFLGEYVEVRCGNYYYAGKLTGVNDMCIELENSHTVYETGAFTVQKYKDAQKHVESKMLVYFGFIESILPIPSSRLGI